MSQKFILKHRQAILVILLVLITLFALAIYRSNSQNETSDVANDLGIEFDTIKSSSTTESVITLKSPKITKETSLTQTQQQKANQNLIEVDIKGEIKQAGVYNLPLNSTLYDLIKAAQGFTKAAAVDYLNQAMLLEDHQLYRIPSLDEISSLKQAKHAAETKEILPGILPVLAPEFKQQYLSKVLTNSAANAFKQKDGQKALELNQADLAGASPITTNLYKSQALNTTSSQKLNINQCSLEELKTVKGIGPKTAALIIEYRELHGPFRALEDLQAIKGIKIKRLHKLKDYLYCD